MNHAEIAALWSRLDALVEATAHNRVFGRGQRAPCALRWTVRSPCLFVCFFVCLFARRSASCKTSCRFLSNYALVHSPSPSMPPLFPPTTPKPCPFASRCAPHATGHTARALTATSADVLLGVHGAGLVLLLFARPFAWVIEIVFRSYMEPRGALKGLRSQGL